MQYQTTGKRHLQKIQQQTAKIYYLKHHLISSNQIHGVEKLITKELYFISLQHERNTPTSQNYFQSMF